MAMLKRNFLASALAAGVFVVLLTGCAGSAESPSDPGTAEPTTPSAPVGTGDFVPDDVWFGGLDAARTSLNEYVGWWAAQDCSYATVIEGDFNCTIHLAGIQEGIAGVDSFLADVVNVAPGSEELVAGLQDAAAASVGAAEAATAFSDSGCDFSPGEECTAGADAMVAGGQALDAALAEWVVPATS